MNEQSRKNMVQAGILVALLAVLGFAVIHMLGTVNKKTGNPAKSAAARSTQDRPTSTNMPPVVRSTNQPSAGSEIASSDLHLNPDQFRVFSLDPPRNPFVQKTEWYNDQLNKIPGYPQLKDDKYFDQERAYLPDLPELLSKDWESVTVNKVVRNGPTEITGTSADGEISTTVTATPKPTPPDMFTWTPESGVPLSAMRKPDWRKRYGDEINATATVPASGKPDSSDLFLDGQLGVPGGSSGGERGLDGLTSAGAGDRMHVVGVSIKGERASALVLYNGSTFLVKEGTMLPTHYKVLRIKDNGVLLQDVADKSNKWVPLGPPPVADKGAQI